MDNGGQLFLYLVGGLVMLMVAASVTVSLFDRSYQTPTALWGLGGMVVGSLFSDAYLRRARKRIEDDIDNQTKEK